MYTIIVDEIIHNTDCTKLYGESFGIPNFEVLDFRKNDVKIGDTIEYIPLSEELGRYKRKITDVKNS